jgi:hypothetical protein
MFGNQPEIVGNVIAVPGFKSSSAREYAYDFKNDGVFDRSNPREGRTAVTCRSGATNESK